jgi:NAD(P)H-flavin reductase
MSMATSPAAELERRGAMTPLPYRVGARTQETADSWTLCLEPVEAGIEPTPGQFNMLYAFGVGEVPISTSGEATGDGSLLHTVRAVGEVTQALCATEPGDVIGVRGPFGTNWPLEEARGGDLVIVAGGIGLAPLRPALYHALTHRDDFGAVSLLVGARTPADVLYTAELERWRLRPDVDVDVTVDAAPSHWRGNVGVVTRLVPKARLDPGAATALVCGPEVMMSFAVKALVERGLEKDRIYVSLERSMRCAVGHCGHCQLGPLLICRDGPVFRYDRVERLLEVREL